MAHKAESSSQRCPSLREKTTKFAKPFSAARQLDRHSEKNKMPKRSLVSAFNEKLAATYSRRTYRTTTIGKTVFDGRVRNGNGSDHSFMATKKKRGQTSEVRSQL